MTKVFTKNVEDNVIFLKGCIFFQLDDLDSGFRLS